jgi:hypothetical protein
MIVTNGLDISGKDCFGRREDLSFIVRFHWKTPDHLKEAIQVLLAARLASAENMPSAKPYRRRNEFLDEQEFEQIRIQIASNPNTPTAVLEYLARNASARVLERIAENPHVPMDLLENLATHSDANIRSAVGDNLKTPASVLVKLVADEDADVRYRLAENPAMPAFILELLTQDENPYVVARATTTMTRLSCVQEHIACGSGREQGQLLQAIFGDRMRGEEQAKFSS